MRHFYTLGNGKLGLTITKLLKVYAPYVLKCRWFSLIYNKVSNKWVFIFVSINSQMVNICHVIKGISL